MINFDRAADEYDASRYIPADVRDHAAHAIAAAAGITPGDVLLDAGVGTGRYAVPLAAIGVRVIGFDISERMMARLRVKAAALPADRAALRIARADLRALPLRSRSCDAALLVHILHLIPDWRIVLDEVHRTLRRSGVVVFATDSGRSDVRSFYHDEARRMGQVRDFAGATSAQTVHEYLKANGALVSTGESAALRWSVQTPVRDTLHYLRQRHWSSLWTIPDAAHNELMQRTEEFAARTLGSTDAVESSEGKLVLWTAHWDD